MRFMQGGKMLLAGPRRRGVRYGIALHHLVGAPVADALAVRIGLRDRHRAVTPDPHQPPTPLPAPPDADQPASALARRGVLHRMLRWPQRRRLMAIGDEDHARAVADAPAHA